MLLDEIERVCDRVSTFFSGELVPAANPIHQMKDGMTVCLGIGGKLQITWNVVCAYGKKHRESTVNYNQYYNFLTTFVTHRSNTQLYHPVKPVDYIWKNVAQTVYIWKNVYT